MKTAIFPATGLLLQPGGLPSRRRCTPRSTSIPGRSIRPRLRKPPARPLPAGQTRRSRRAGQARRAAARARRAGAAGCAGHAPVIHFAARRTHPPPRRRPATIVADAPGEASAIPGGIRLTFGPGRPELNQKTADAVRGLAAAIAARNQPTATFTITSLSGGNPDDSSAARRLSLARGLSVRSLLIGDGVASTRIFVKAMGLASDSPADRVDIIVAEPPKPAAPPSQPPAPQTPARPAP